MEISVNNLLKPAFVALALAMAGAASPAAAEEWKRPTVHGGELTREVTRDGRVYQGETTRVGPNGGAYSSSATCFDGFVDRCKRTYSATGPEGKTVSGKTYTARGPYRVRRAGVVTGPNGNTVLGVRRFWRR
jgi:hypothetical protein